MKGKLFLVSIVWCLYSCSIDETGTYSESFGVAKLSDSNMLYIKSDDGEVLIPNQSISTHVEAGERIWISYEIEEDTNRDTLTVTPYRISHIMPIALQSETKLNDNGIDLWTAWVAQDFLTFDFRIRANDAQQIKNHEYALVSQQREITDTLFVELRHDAHGDNYGVLCRTAITLKLDDLKIAGDSVFIVIDYRNLDGVKQREYHQYKKAKD
jgi:hypothetical protein